MGIALGIHVGAYEVSAVLVESTLPDLGPVASRTVSSTESPEAIAGAVTTVLGIMRVQAAQNDIPVVGAAVVCDSSPQRDTVDAALVAHRILDVEVLVVDDPRLATEFPLNVAAALVGCAVARTNGPAEVGGDDSVRAVGSRESPRGARMAMIGLGVVVLAALSGATVWALAAADPAGDSVVGTADATDAPGSASGVVGTSAAAPSADPAGTVPLSESAEQPTEPGAFEGSVNGAVTSNGSSELPPFGGTAGADREPPRRPSNGVVPGRADTGGIDSTTRRPSPAPGNPTASGEPPTETTTTGESSPPETSESGTDPIVDPGGDSSP